MSGIARTLAPRISREVLKLRDRTLLEGAMATSALVAMADQRILIEEDLAVGALLENLELLKIYDPEFAVALHTGYVERMRTDFEAGREEALKAVAACGGDVLIAELLVKVGVAVAKADSVFSTEEVEVIEEICRSLGIEGLDALGFGGLRSGGSSASRELH